MVSTVSEEQGVQPSIIVFYYKLSDLFDEVYKRTSYIAKSRRDKDTGATLLNLIALTQDDNSVFSPFLQDAGTKILQTLSAFTKQVSPAYLYLASSGLGAFISNKIYHLGDKIVQNGIVWECDQDGYTDQSFDNGSWKQLDSYHYTDDKVEFIITRPNWVNTNAASSTDTAIFEALVSYIMARWFKIVFPQEYAAYAAEYEEQKSTITSSLNSQNRALNRRHRMF